MPPALLEVGRIDRAHGLRGEVVVGLLTNKLERLDRGARLLARSPDGRQRDLVVVASRPHGHRFIVLFETLATREQAESLHGWALLAASVDEAPQDGGIGELYVHELIGSAVVESGGIERGTVTSVEANPASDLLVLDDKWYVPLRFVVERRSDGTLVVDVPEGLFE